ncbi:MAG: haloacid dehalogenase type II [Acidobacteria bacterium]|nr:haloacid dehalogenase type II [Acidobacteriota bacterium]
MPPTGLPPPRWVSFDCYGTLIDWQTGVQRAFRDLAHVSEDETQEMFEAWERIQWEKTQGPYVPYEEILWSSFRQAVEGFGYWCPGYAGEAFVESLARWLPFADVNPALLRLSQRYRLAIISNVDRHLLGGTIKNFPVRFDVLVTAEDARAYKPSLALFRLALERMGCQPQEVAHVAFGAKYDLRAANELGMRTIYLNRNSGASPEVAVEAEIHSLEEMTGLW